MSINEINEQAKQSLKKYFKDSQDIQHDDDTKKQLTIEEMYQSVDDEIKNYIKCVMHYNITLKKLMKRFMGKLMKQQK